MAPLAEGYVRLEVAGADVVAHARLADAIRVTFERGTMYSWAAAHPARREMQGRLPVFAAPLPHDGPTVVVRHAHHGGWLAPLMRDLFLPPTRARRELGTALHLARAGVPTPPVAAYAIYRAGPVLRRVDVMTVELPGQDLGAALRAAVTVADRQRLVRPVSALLGALTQAGAWHPDLNVKNVLLVSDDAGELHPAVLDIDRMRFVPPGDPNLREANYRRLARSVAKWQRQYSVGFTREELLDIRERLVQDEAVQAAHRALAMAAYMP